MPGREGRSSWRQYLKYYMKDGTSDVSVLCAFDLSEQMQSIFDCQKEIRRIERKKEDGTLLEVLERSN